MLPQKQEGNSSKQGSDERTQRTPRPYAKGDFSPNLLHDSDGKDAVFAGVGFGGELHHQLLFHEVRCAPLLVKMTQANREDVSKTRAALVEHGLNNEGARHRV